MLEIILSTGKKIELREKKGQHHFIERKLLASSMDEGGHNIGGVMSTLTVQNIISVDAVNGEKVDVPQNLAEIFEVMDKFTYEEWAEFEKENMPRSVKDKLEELAKN